MSVAGLAQREGASYPAQVTAQRRIAFGLCPLAFAIVLAACSGGVEGSIDEPSGRGPGVEPAPGGGGPTVIDARIAVSRSTLVAGSEQEAVEFSEAMAQFAQSTSENPQTLAAAGLEPVLPASGQCLGAADPAAGSFASLGEVQLLDVGEVKLVPLQPEPVALNPADSANPDAASPDPASPDPANPDAQANAAGLLGLEGVSLAPHAFPSISSFVSGVVYTTRDRAARALPSGVTYRVQVEGSSSLPGFSVLAQAPEQLSHITLGGEPYATLNSVSVAAPLDATWAVGRPGDLVIVELSNADDGSALVRCTFADEVGAGSVPLERLVGLSGNGQVSIHRRRVQQTGLQAITAGDVNAALRDTDLAGSLLRVSFDLETTRRVEFTP